MMLQTLSETNQTINEGFRFSANNDEMTATTLLTG